MHENILVIAAHPDDEVLGCGGTIARLTREGHDVYIAILGEGITSRYQQREQAEPEQVNALHACSQQAADLLGAKDIFVYDVPDNRFDTVPLLEVVKLVEELIDRVHPQTIYTHHSGDLNIDHVVVHQAVLTATRPVPGCQVKEIYAFEVPSSTEWAFGQYQDSFCPNMFMDISATLKTKLQAMEVYESEIRQFPHPRSLKALRAIGQKWGSVAGVEAAEAFQLIRRIR